RAFGVKQTDDIVEISNTTAPVRDVTPISTDRAQLLALGSGHERRNIRVPAEAIVNQRTIIGLAGGEGLLQCTSWYETLGIQSLIPKKQVIKCGEKAAVAHRQHWVIPALKPAIL